jgi:protein-S-isoprenylcysteine O-methyltransferase Ste14
MLALLVFFIVFFTAAMVVPTVRVWRQTGINPVVLPKSDDVAGFVGKAFKILILALGLYLIAGSVRSATVIGAIPVPEIAAMLGWGLLVVSLGWVVIAQFQMGRSWRVGVDTHVRTELVIQGLFRFSRNPIFLGMIVQLVGLFLVQPDAITLAILLAGYLMISVQIRQEEEHLLALHGDAYRQYCGKVRRWL